MADQEPGPDRGFGERTHGQRLVTYGAFALVSAVITILVYTGTWDISDAGLFRPVLYVAAPLGVVTFAYRFIQEALDR
jgi:hypothetical protein